MLRSSTRDTTRYQKYWSLYGIIDSRYNVISMKWHKIINITWYLKVKLTLEMLTVRGLQHSILTHERVYLRKCQSFWGRKCLDLRETRTPTFGFMPNALTYWAIRARHLLSHVFEYWLWRCRYFLSKVNIWNVNCARATAFIFDTRMGVLAKVSKFLRQKMFRPEGDSNPQPWAIRARHLLSHVFEYWLWRCRYFWSKVYR